MLSLHKFGDLKLVQDQKHIVWMMNPSAVCAIRLAMPYHQLDFP